MAGWTRVAVVAVTLLIAASVTMGIAALVLRGPQTWRSTDVVRASDNVVDLQVTRQNVYLLTGPTAGAASVPATDVRADLQAAVSGDTLVVTAEAAYGSQAEALAEQAAVLIANAEPNRGHLDAELTPTPAVRLKPTLLSGLGLGAIAGAAVVVVAALAGSVRRSGRQDRL